MDCSYVIYMCQIDIERRAMISEELIRIIQQFNNLASILVSVIAEFENMYSNFPED